MTIAILGPGGVGGLLAGVLAREGNDVLVIARESTAELVTGRGLAIRSVLFGDFTAHPRAAARLDEDVEALIVATKASGLEAALERIAGEPALVLPQLNGLDHLALLRERFGERAVAGTIRVEADRPEPGVIVHSSPFLYVEMASAAPAMQTPMNALVSVLQAAGVPAGIGASEAQVMWSKLVRLNALACTTSAYDRLLGEIRSTPELYDDFKACIREAATVARAEGAEIDPEQALAEFDLAHETLGSSMQRDIAAGRTPELDAIPGAVLRSGARHDIPCPTIARLHAAIAERAGLPAGAA
ncbi:MAG: 2-dehydropantoate 2-reductase [Acidobacteriota bacterium]|nr:2-dehydropantoate 2-reductase [Acidobacteriota bacterium]